MKISTRTKQILKNFAAVNQNVLLSQGEKIRTLAPSKTVYAEAIVEESFPCEFGIYDLNEFLGILNIFSDPELHFEKNFVKISQGKDSVVEYKNGNTIDLVSGVDYSTTNNVSLALSQKSYIDKANPNTNNFDVQIADSDVKFEYHLKTEFVAKLLGEDFNVRIQSEKKAVVFEGDNKTYMIAAESDSTI